MKLGGIAPRRVHARLARMAGSRDRARVIGLLGLALAFNSADTGNIGAIAGNLEHALRIDNTELGLVVAIPSLAAALGTVPVGVLADRVNRARLLAGSMFVWAVVMGVSAVSPSYEVLLLTRVALGLAMATSGPPVASLIGDYFAPAERGRVWGLILSGELLGAGFGFLVSGELASLLGWRWSFVALGAASGGAAWITWRGLREPLRGGADRLPDRTHAIVREAGDEQALAREQVRRRHVPPRADLVLHSDPESMSLVQAARYVLRIPTNAVLILTSSLGYFYFTGVETFGLIYLSGRYGISHSVATLLLVLIGISALAGVVAGGRIADALLARGRITARVDAGVITYLAATALFLPAMFIPSLPLAMVLLIASGIAFGARNPPLDAARLDVMHHRLWGRAEAVRGFLRQLLTAFAPLLFGAIADALAPGRGHPTAAGANSGDYGFGANASAAGVHDAFLILLVLLLVGGLLTLRARRTYPRDVATAGAFEEATAAAGQGEGGGAREAA
jgi:predicted MFS family arabinose efflux permease